MAIDTLTPDQWHMLWMIMAGFFGLAIGSFLNVIIYRVPNDISIVSPGSHCPSCEHSISPQDNIPLISFLILKGKCRNCGTKISIRYPLIELLTAVVSITTVYFAGLHIKTIGLVLFFAGLIALSAIDIDLKLLPKKIVYPLGLILFILYFLDAVVTDQYGNLIKALISGVAYCVFLFIIWFASGGKAMGFGDVRLALLLGFAMGYYGFVVAYFGMLFSFAIGSVLGIILAAVSGKGRKMKIPFGPFLAAGTVLVIWFAQPISEWMKF